MAVFNAQVDEFESVLNKQHVVQMDTFIKLRGLPYSITADEIEAFFDGKCGGVCTGRRCGYGRQQWRARQLDRTVTIIIIYNGREKSDLSLFGLSSSRNNNNNNNNKQWRGVP